MKRPYGCECQLEAGDSPCIVHGLYEEDGPTDPRDAQDRPQPEDFEPLDLNDTNDFEVTPR